MSICSIRFSAALAASLLLPSCLSETAKPAAKSGETTPQTNTTSKPSEPAAKKPAASMPDKTPAVFKVRFETTVGPFTMECHRDWAPLGADRFFELVKTGFFKDIGFFRVMPSFMVQFGIHGDPETAGEWRGQRIMDDPIGKASNTPGMVSFATSGPNSRTTQIFINYVNNRRLDAMGFTPFAKVVEGMENVRKIFNAGQRPSQQLIQSRGNAYLKESFPQLDYIQSATYVQ